MKATRIAERNRYKNSVVNQEEVVIYLHHADDIKIHAVGDGMLDPAKSPSVAIEIDRNGEMRITQVKGDVTVNFNG